MQIARFKKYDIISISRIEFYIKGFEYMQNNISSNANFGLQSNFLRTNNMGIKTTSSKSASAYYAKKGEPMYMKEMDADEDGLVSFEEFKDYCDEKGISVNERIKMTQMASSYRMMQAQKKATENINKKDKTENHTEDTDKAEEAVYAKRGDGKYDEVMDTNNDDKITYKEYIEYCREHSKTQDEKANTKVEETEDGEFKTTSSGKAVKAYSSQESQPPEGKVYDEG